MKRAYERDWKPSRETQGVIDAANAICSDYQRRGYDLTLRQLYYQFVGKAWLPNNQKSYDRLGRIVNRARMNGLMDWSHIVDRTRNVRSRSHWNSPSEILDSAAASYHVDLWEESPVRIEVWVEKEALAGVVSRVANEYDVPWFSCRGYTSQSEMWESGRRIGRNLAQGQPTLILHLGDHDPSGIDMTRDIVDRLNTFVYSDWIVDHARNLGAETGSEAIYLLQQSLRSARSPVQVKRIALNYDQVEEYGCPPNPAKITDSRAKSYVQEHGYQSWELDALDPSVLHELIASHIRQNRDQAAWDRAIAKRDAGREALRRVAGAL